MKSTIIGLALAGLLSSVGVMLAPEAKASWVEYVCTQSTPLTMRAGPSINSRVIGSVPKGHYVVVHFVDWNSGYAYVTYGGKSGWVAYWYLCY